MTRRARARAVIDRVVGDCLALRVSRERTIEAIDASYPFGPREHHPYRVWLTERRKVLAALDRPGAANARPCPACGAGPWHACRPIGESDEATVHEARR